MDFIRDDMNIIPSLFLAVGAYPVDFLELNESPREKSKPKIEDRPFPGRRRYAGGGRPAWAKDGAS
jgi:hypothetical protein